MQRVIIYIHGKGGSAEEANHYRSLFPGSDVVGFDYTSPNPWDAQDEFPRLFDSYSKGYDEVILIANSIGAFFAMSALAEKGWTVPSPADNRKKRPPVVEWNYGPYPVQRTIEKRGLLL